ncbi:uncharacterized protein LOC144307509 [Canis aureus]
MEKDVVSHEEALVSQANNTDPGTAAAEAGPLPEAENPPEGAPAAASSGVDVGQESTGPGENEEMQDMSVVSMPPSVKADGGPCPEGVLVPGNVTPQGANPEGNAGKPGSGKRRNRKRSTIVYLPWPLTLQTRASSAAPVLGQTRILGSLSLADTEEEVVYETSEPGGDKEAENTAVLSQPQEAPADALWPAASPVEPPLEDASLAANEEINKGRKNRRKGRNKKNRRIMASPWPLTVQAWASVTGSDQAETASAGDSSLDNDGASVEEHKSQGPEGEEDNPSAEALYQSAQEEAPESSAHLEQASGEEGESLAADSEGDGEQSGHKRSTSKEKSVLAHPWPLTVQAWASFRAADSVQAQPQEESSAASIGVAVGQKKQPQLENSKEEAKSASPWPVRAQASAPFSESAQRQVSLKRAPSQDPQSKVSQTRRGCQGRCKEQVQGNAEQTVESGQEWRSTERYPEDQDFWECTVVNFARQVDCRYCGELCSQERMESLTVTKTHTHMGT